MAHAHNLFNTLQEFKLASGRKGKLYSLPALEKALGVKVSRLPVSLRIVLEAVLRHCDGKKVTEAHVRELAGWKPRAPRTEEIPFVLARILLQDFTGIPSLVDLAAMRSVARKMSKDPKVIEPLVPVDLVVDHSIQIDHYGTKNALDLNMRIEFQRNQERYQFMKWAMQAFDTFKVVPPGVGIVHQVNLEYLARGVHHKDGIYYPDSLVGTDSHTTMINGIGVVAWGVGGIEAEAGMLGQPNYFLTPDVVGVNLKGRLRGGVTATDLVLTVTEMLRKAKVVGKFVEFFGEGAESLTVPDRATLGNMAPEYGATMGFFPVDDQTIAYFEGTGRSKDEIDALKSYFKAQGMYGIPKPGQIDYSETYELDLATVAPSVAGPKRPQDRIEIGKVKSRFGELFSKPAAEAGFSKRPEDLGKRVKTRDGIDLGSGDVLIAAITSCTNTSNPGVLLAAGLLAKKAVAHGLTVKKHVKTSLAPGSRVVTDYLQKTGLLPYLEKLGFYLSAYGCTTCIGNSGPLAETIEETVNKNDLVCASVLSGNRNFEARIHAAIRANFIMSPPLVVAYAIAGTVLRDLMSEPIGRGKNGKDVWIGDIWPTSQEIYDCMKYAMDAKTFRRLYGNVAEANPMWKSIPSPRGDAYTWPASTYIAEPPFFKDFSMQPGGASPVRNARVLGVFGDSITTDHISPAGAIKPTSAAGTYLRGLGIAEDEFNSYGARRGNHEVMVRGTFANVRIRNLMVPGVEGGVTRHQPSGERMSIYDAAERYRAEGVPLIVIAGRDYGAGSSRDWAAKGTRLLGVRAVVARGFERIHRSNLIDLGVLPCQLPEEVGAGELELDGSERFALAVSGPLRPGVPATLTIERQDGRRDSLTLLVRIDTPIEAAYFSAGGILPYVLERLIGEEQDDIS
jgi:aconitate hydratase